MSQDVAKDIPRQDAFGSRQIAIRTNQGVVVHEFDGRTSFLPRVRRDGGPV